jgi:hypothetical protein
MKTNNYSKMLKDIASFFEFGLYQSWILVPDYIPDSLEVTTVS